MLQFDEHIFAHVSKYVGNLERRDFFEIVWDLSVEGFLEAKESKQIVSKELSASSVEKRQLLTIFSQLWIYWTFLHSVLHLMCICKQLLSINRFLELILSVGRWIAATFFQWAACASTNAVMSIYTNFAIVCQMTHPTPRIALFVRSSVTKFQLHHL